MMDTISVSDKFGFCSLSRRVMAISHRQTLRYLERYTKKGNSLGKVVH